MALKNSELYSSLWASCDELRGGMDASQYKDYVLVLLFLNCISDKYANRIKELADRYDTPVKTLSGRVVDLESKVNDHLRKMGFAKELEGAS